MHCIAHMVGLKKFEAMSCCTSRASRPRPSHVAGSEPYIWTGAHSSGKQRASTSTTEPFQHLHHDVVRQRAGLQCGGPCYRPLATTCHRAGSMKETKHQRSLPTAHAQETHTCVAVAVGTTSACASWPGTCLTGFCGCSVLEALAVLPPAWLHLRRFARRAAASCSSSSASPNSTTPAPASPLAAGRPRLLDLYVQGSQRSGQAQAKYTTAQG